MGAALGGRFRGFPLRLRRGRATQQLPQGLPERLGEVPQGGGRALPLGQAPIAQGGAQPHHHFLRSASIRRSLHAREGQEDLPSETEITRRESMHHAPRGAGAHHDHIERSALDESIEAELYLDDVKLELLASP